MIDGDRSPTARAVVLRDGVWGHRSSAAREQRTGPQEKREPDRESGRLGRRGLGASEERSRVQRGEHRTGPQEI